jgi:hypothetical protein
VCCRSSGVASRSSAARIIVVAATRLELTAGGVGSYERAELLRGKTARKSRRPGEVSGVSVADEIVRFEQDIKPLFRPEDYESMAWAFDLSSYDEVKDHASVILERLREGSMPCDGEWPEEHVQRFQRWTETGMFQ